MNQNVLFIRGLKNITDGKRQPEAVYNCGVIKDLRMLNWPNLMTGLFGRCCFDLANMSNLRTHFMDIFITEEPGPSFHSQKKIENSDESLRFPNALLH